MTEYQMYLAAISIIDAGWSPDDVEEIQEEYRLTNDEAEGITKLMQTVMEGTKMKNKFSVKKLHEAIADGYPYGPDGTNYLTALVLTHNLKHEAPKTDKDIEELQTLLETDDNDTLRVAAWMIKIAEE